MSNPFKVGLVVLCLLAGSAASAAADELEDGLVAYKRGDYAAAFALWKPLAEQGVAGVQYGIGTMYEYGQGVSQDLAEAMTWYRRAADQGNLSAQYSLGLMYATGTGVPQDYVQAYMWLLLAETGGFEDQDHVLDAVSVNMTSEQITEAMKLLSERQPQ